MRPRRHHTTVAGLALVERNRDGTAARPRFLGCLFVLVCCALLLVCESLRLNTELECPALEPRLVQSRTTQSNWRPLRLRTIVALTVTVGRYARGRELMGVTQAFELYY